ncbi:MAG: protein translocase subunit SecD [Kiritimatiellia bacterium]
MDRNAIWKWLILLALLSVSFMLVTPPGDKIRLGLDLQGGTSFTVKIDEERVREDIEAEAGELTPEEIRKKTREKLQGAQERALVVLRNRIDNLGIEEPVIYPGKDNRIVIQLPGTDENQRRAAERTIKKLAFLEFKMVHENNAALVRELFDRGLSPEGYVIAHGSGGMLYKRAPAFPDSDRDQEYFENLRRFEVPDPAYEFLLQETEEDGDAYYRPYFVERRPEMTGKYLKSARAVLRPAGGPVVSISFDAKGARRFADVTGDYAPGGPRNPDPESYRQMAIVLDGVLHSAPVIREAIYSGDAQIEGNFTMAEARRLEGILKAGSLPAPVKMVEKLFVAPSLGRDAVVSGIRAVLFGGAGVLVFMLAYYLVSGIIADLALVVTMCLLPLGMTVAAGFLGIFAQGPATGGAVRLPVLTLPGIAGILLTVGMAVDANVLIFERIREEMKQGKRLWPGITAGYDRAFVTITDANVTTLLTGVVLFIFGSGSIRGFAVTLCGGIIVSLYTALVVTKMFFSVLASRTNVKTLKMFRLIGDTAIDFVSRRKAAAVLSVLVIAASWVVMGMRLSEEPGKVFGVDFTGGAATTFTFREKVSLEKIRERLETAGVEESYIQYQKDIEKNVDKFLLVRTGIGRTEGADPAEKVKRCLTTELPSAGFEVAQEEEIGPQIGRELKKRAIWSMIWALFVIIVYISWRFELGFAVAAIVAVAHDVLVTVGLYSLFGRQISLPIVAALLTIVGYSVNDTIVVFDRIRENLKSMRRQSFREICNISVNQTLNRTLLTSLTTLITIAMLLLFGGGLIFDFALALCIGVVIGTYSSVFVATPVALLWHKDRKPGFAA